MVVNRNFKKMEKAKKYELTKEFKVVGSTKVFRIKALRDFGNVKKGDIGGWIEKEENLSQEGNAWVSDNVLIFDDAQISGNVLIFDDVRISDNAQICGDAQISGDAQIFGDALICGNVQIFGKSRISGDARISKTPLQIQGSKHFVNMNGDLLQIGCQLYSIPSWKEHFERIGKAEKYTKEEIKEYKLYIDLAEKLMDLN